MERTGTGRRKAAAAIRVYTGADAHPRPPCAVVPQAGMGLTLTFGEIASVFTKQPQLLALGMVLQVG